MYIFPANGAIKNTKTEKVIAIQTVATNLSTYKNFGIVLTFPKRKSNVKISKVKNTKNTQRLDCPVKYISDIAQDAHSSPSENEKNASASTTKITTAILFKVEIVFLMPTIIAKILGF